MALLIPATQCVLHMPCIVSVGKADKQLSFCKYSIGISILLKNCFFKRYKLACLFQHSSKKHKDFTLFGRDHKYSFSSNLNATSKHIFLSKFIFYKTWKCCMVR